MRNMDRCKRVVYTYTGEVQGHLRSLAWRSGVAEKIKTGLYKEAFYDERKSNHACAMDSIVSVCT